MDSIKAKIRLEKAQRKINKRVYPTCQKTKNVVKLNERYEQLGKDIDKTYSTMYSEGFRPNIDNQNPKFFEYFDFILSCENERAKISRKVDKLCVQLGKTETQIAEEMYNLNAGRGSTSY